MVRNILKNGCSHFRNGYKNAGSILDDFEGSGNLIDSTVYAQLLQNCGNAKALLEGRQIHAHAIRSGFQQNVFVGGHLIEMYVKCGKVIEAREVFDKLRNKGVISWTRMISAYVQDGDQRQAMELFYKMQVVPTKVTFVTILTACVGPEFLEDGRSIHCKIFERGLEWDVFIGTALVNMYRQCGSVDDACMAFNRIKEQDAVAWTSVIMACCQHDRNLEALDYFRKMQVGGIMPNKATITYALQACGFLQKLKEGVLVYENAISYGIEIDSQLTNALLSMYGRCGRLDKGRSIFDRLKDRSVVVWNIMITEYAQSGRFSETLQVFIEMQLDGVKPDDITFTSLLNAIGGIEYLHQGKLIHSNIVESGFEQDVVVATALINMYGKCESVEDAVQMFEKMIQRDTVSWTVMIVAYAQNGYRMEALQLFQQMQLEAMKPNSMTLVALADTCSQLAALSEGRKIHARVIASGVDSEVIVGTAIVNMYGKCGKLEEARAVFDKMPRHDILGWNTLIAAYAQHGHSEETLQLFHQMQLEDMNPSNVTLVSVLSALSHAGLVDVCHSYFISMYSDFGLEQTCEHFGCIVDLLGRAGRIEEAVNFIGNLPSAQPGSVWWMALLGSCRIHNNILQAEFAAEKALELDADNSGAYVVLSNIYATSGEWEEADI